MLSACDQSEYNSVVDEVGNDDVVANGINQRQVKRAADVLFSALLLSDSSFISTRPDLRQACLDTAQCILERMLALQVEVWGYTSAHPDLVLLIMEFWRQTLAAESVLSHKSSVSVSVYAETYSQGSRITSQLKVLVGNTVHYTVLSFIFNFPDHAKAH